MKRLREVQEAALEWRDYLNAARHGHLPQEEMRDMDEALIKLTGMLTLGLIEKGDPDGWQATLDGAYTALTKWLAKAEALAISHNSHVSRGSMSSGGRE